MSDTKFHYYFVSFSHGLDALGFGAIEVVREHLIERFDQVIDVVSLIESDPEIKNVVILNYILLRTEHIK